MLIADVLPPRGAVIERRGGADAEGALFPRQASSIALRPPEPDGLLDEGHPDRLLPSAEESVFGTWYPLTGDELGCHEAVNMVSRGPGGAEGGRVVARRSRRAPGVPETAAGRWAADGSVTVTAAVPARG